MTPIVLHGTFISYSHDSSEHKSRVLQLADSLNNEGVDTTIDQYISAPSEGWHRWSANQLTHSARVIIVWTPEYSRRCQAIEGDGTGLGSNWEGSIITGDLYRNYMNSDKYLHVVFSKEDTEFLPAQFAGYHVYDLSSNKGYEDLYRKLTNQPSIIKPAVGEIVQLPTISNSRSGSFPLNPSTQPYFSSKSSLFDEVSRLLAENAYIHSSFGPDSTDAKSNPLTAASQLWRARKLDTIIPNNEKICRYIEDHRALMSSDEWNTYLKFKVHSKSFSDRANGLFEGDSPRFPLEFREMILSAEKE